MKLKNYEVFWKKKINLISWKKKPKKIFELKKNTYPSWFSDGKINKQVAELTFS